MLGEEEEGVVVGGVDDDEGGGMVLSSSLSSGAVVALRLEGVDPRPGVSEGWDRDRDRDREGDPDVDVDDGEAGMEGVRSRLLRRRPALFGESVISDGDLAWNMKSWSCRRPLKVAGGGEFVGSSSSIGAPEGGKNCTAIYKL